MIVNKKGKSFKRFKGNSCSDFGGSGSDGYNGGYDGGMVGGSGQQAPKVDFTTSLKAKSNKKSKTIWSNAKKVIRAPLAIPGAVIGSTAALGVGALRGVAKVGESAKTKELDGRIWDKVNGELWVEVGKSNMGGKDGRAGSTANGDG